MKPIVIKGNPENVERKEQATIAVKTNIENLPRPAWDDSASDLNKYRLSIEEQELRKQYRKSKHYGQSVPKSEGKTRLHSRETSTSRDNNLSSSINYANVLKLLNNNDSEQGVNANLATPSTFPAPCNDSLKVEKAPRAFADESSPSSCGWIPSFSDSPSPSSTLPVQDTNEARRSVSATTSRPAPSTSIEYPSSSSSSSIIDSAASKQKGVVSAVAAADLASAAVSRTRASLNRLERREKGANHLPHALESRLNLLESRCPAELLDEVVDLRGVLSGVKRDQGELKKEFDAFSTQVTSMLSALQG
eukprot:CAMPEP_0175040034 /NCGR_PEP_ID=MMETSP0052_2-20121109/1000_1 /TAXON_ID=51329 ORGANISM="Polytomella parva, Strain SAG 63-3" /NCGR_SAMPLE_ID=MMETSP0052_2 /ASSEMBLY_ACC=CAM_ASM_000194 /LENGTH=305 /DNA_ID=CAMNT_0016302123 /DNA_START=9 /DNA_END=922 /DNA_ORIENTATION=+